MQRSETITELAKALSKFQGAMKSVPKDSTNPFFKNRYASLDAIWDTIRKPLADSGLAVIQAPYEQDGNIYIETTLLHMSGEWVQGDQPINAKATDPQSIGSAMTYARRYSLSAILGVSSDDDEDGNAASGKETPKATQQTQSTTKAPAGQPAGQAGQGEASAPHPGNAKAADVIFGADKPGPIPDPELYARIVKAAGMFVAQPEKIAGWIDKQSVGMCKFNWHDSDTKQHTALVEKAEAAAKTKLDAEAAKEG